MADTKAKAKCVTGYGCKTVCIAKNRNCLQELTSDFSKQAANWLQTNKGTAKDAVVNTGGLVGSIIGGKVAGAGGALAGDLIGAMVVRKSLVIGEAAFKAKEQLALNEAFQRANRLQQISQFTRATISQLGSREFQHQVGDDLTGDITGWAIGNASARLLSMVPGVGGLPFKGAAVAMATVPRIVAARRRLQIAMGVREMSEATSIFERRLARLSFADPPAAPSPSPAPTPAKTPTPTPSTETPDTPDPALLPDVPFNKYDEVRREVEATRKALIGAIGPALKEQDNITVNEVSDFDLDGQDFIGLLDTDRGLYSFRIFKSGSNEQRLSYQPAPPLPDPPPAPTPDPMAANQLNSSATPTDSATSTPAPSPTPVPTASG